MNKADKQRVLRYAENNVFDKTFAEQAGLIGDLINKDPGCTLTLHQVALICKYQAMQLNGEWSVQGLDEFWRWTKRVQVL